jgi:uncharacterized delta-60 repeat protein
MRRHRFIGGICLHALLLVVSTEVAISQINIEGGAITEAEAAIGLRRRGDVSGAASVQVGLRSGGAEAGLDFDPALITVEFAPGESAKSFTPPVFQDGLVELDELVELYLTNAVGGVLGAGSKTSFTIYDSQEPVLFDKNFHNYSLGQSVTALRVDGQGRILAGGFYGSVVRLNSDGILDPSFRFDVPNSDHIKAFKSLPDGKILVGGQFRMIGEQVGKPLVRLLPNGAKDESFETQEGRVFLAFQSDGKALVDIWAESKHLRLTTDGADDPTFQAISNAAPGSVVQPDGKFLTAIYDETNGSLQRFEADGQSDGSFKPLPINSMPYLLPTRSGDIWLYGYLSGLPPEPASLLKLASNGDVTLNLKDFYMNYGDSAWSEQPDGKLLIAGGVRIDGCYANCVRIDQNGHLDRSFVFREAVPGALLPLDNGMMIVGIGNTIGKVYLTNTTLSECEFVKASFVGAEGSTVAAQVRRFGDTTQRAKVRIQINDKTATRDLDYTVGEATVEFAPLQSLAELRFQLLADQVPEAAERVELILADPEKVQIGSRGRAELIIADLDGGAGNFDPIARGKWQAGHDSRVNALARDPKGRIVAAGYIDQNFAVRFTQDGQRDASLGPLTPGAGAVASMVVDSQARLILGGQIRT